MKQTGLNERAKTELDEALKVEGSLAGGLVADMMKATEDIGKTTREAESVAESTRIFQGKVQRAIDNGQVILKKDRVGNAVYSPAIPGDPKQTQIANGLTKEFAAQLAEEEKAATALIEARNRHDDVQRQAVRAGFTVGQGTGILISRGSGTVYDGTGTNTTQKAAGPKAVPSLPKPNTGGVRHYRRSTGELIRNPLTGTTNEFKLLTTGMIPPPATNAPPVWTTNTSGW